MDQILSILGSVGFNWHVALANFFNFLIILFLLNKFFFKKLGKTIDDRHKIIERGLNQARDAEKALTSAQVQKEEMIRDARKEGQHIITSAEVTAEASSLSIAQKAEEEINVRLGKLEIREASVLADVEKAFCWRLRMGIEADGHLMSPWICKLDRSAVADDHGVACARK